MCVVAFLDCLRLLLRTLESQSKHLYRHNRDLSQTQDAVAKCYSMAGMYELILGTMSPFTSEHKVLFDPSLLQVQPKLSSD